MYPFPKTSRTKTLNVKNNGLRKTQNIIIFNVHLFYTYETQRRGKIGETFLFKIGVKIVVSNESGQKTKYIHLITLYIHDKTSTK